MGYPQPETMEDPSCPWTDPAARRRHCSWLSLPLVWSCFLFGVGTFGSEMHFRAGAKKVTALKVRDAVHGTTLQIRDGKRVIEFPAHSEDNRDLGPVDVLYHPKIKAARYQYESHVRLQGGPIFAALGSLFVLTALVGSLCGKLAARQATC